MEMRLAPLALTSNISVSWSEAYLPEGLFVRSKCFLYRQNNDSPLNWMVKTVYPPDILDSYF